MTETWLPIPGYTRYEVSDLGRVRSYVRPGGPRLRKPAKNVRNHYRYLTVISDEGKPWTIQVHRLVLLAFVGPKPAHLETRHLDGDTENNTLPNLVYGTRLENIRDIDRHGTRHPRRGPRGPIVLDLAPGEMSTAAAAARLGVTPHRLATYCKAGLVKARRQGQAWVIHESALESFKLPKRGRPTNASRAEALERQEDVVSSLRLERAA